NKANGYEYCVQQAGLRLNVGVLPRASYEALLHMPAPVVEDSRLQVTVPMAGVLLSVAVKEGDQVQVGDVLGVVEAMKMEHAITAQTGGQVAEVYFQAGQRASAGDVLLRISDQS